MIPATIAFPGVNGAADTANDSEHEHEHEHEEPEAEPEEKPSALGSIACQAEYDQRAAAHAHRAIPNEARGHVSRPSQRFGPGMYI